MRLADYDVVTPEKIAGMACELFIHDVYFSYPFHIFLFLMPILTIALSFCKRKLWGLLPSFCICLTIAAQIFIMLFEKQLFAGAYVDPQLHVTSYSDFIYIALFFRLFICLALFFAIHYGFPVLKRHVQHKREISQYMKFKREQDKREDRDSDN